MASTDDAVCDQKSSQFMSVQRDLSTFRDLSWNAPFYSKLGFRPVDEAELTTGFQQIRLKELAAGLPIVVGGASSKELS